MISYTEENYLKGIYKIAEKDGKTASTNAIAEAMNTSAASVTDMLKRLAEKELIHYEKYKGVTLAPEGKKLATALIRKHRLWEVFLVDKLLFTWDEVHDIAEQLEHVHSDLLVERLDEFLGRPRFDPHGDPIPDAEGNYAYRQQELLSGLSEGSTGILVGVNEHSAAFLQYLGKMGFALGTAIRVLEKFDYDRSMRILVNETREMTLTANVSQNLFVKPS